MIVNPDLDGFKAWLETRPYTTATKRNYLAMTRIALAAGATCADNINRSLPGVVGRRQYFQQMRTAFRAYDEFRGVAA